VPAWTEKEAVLPKPLPATTKNNLARVLTMLLSCGLLYVIIACAWQSDDAYITYRTVRNAWAGHGLTWNPGERVQSYTHPLWLLVSFLLYGISHDVFYSVIVASILFTMVAAGLVVRAAGPEPRMAALAIVLIATSGAFVDYATSGLENPLLYLLLTLFILVGLNLKTPPSTRFLRLGLLTAAIGLTRLDAVLILSPGLLGACWSQRPRRLAFGNLLVGLLPLVGWEIFSLLSYGSFVPNTALAKLNVAIPVATLVRQGLRYFADSLQRDPVTLWVLAISAGLALYRGSAFHRLIVAGLGLYLVYILCIGGDFMSGRFFAAPYLAAVTLLVTIASRCSHEKAARRAAITGVAVLCGLGIFWPRTRWTSGVDFGQGLLFSDVVRPTGIADERAYYYPTTGLLRVLSHRSSNKKQDLPTPPYAGAVAGARFARPNETVAVWNEVGFFGLFSGDDKTVIDLWSLCDPLLARIPFRAQGAWRIGHFPRRIPLGYVESRQTGRNLLEDPGLAAVYDSLTLVTRGPLFSAARWREIWRLNTGYYTRALGKPDDL